MEQDRTLTVGGAPFINGCSNLQLQVGAAPFIKGATLQLEPNIFIKFFCLFLQYN